MWTIQNHNQFYACSFIKMEHHIKYRNTNKQFQYSLDRDKAPTESDEGETSNFSLYSTSGKLYLRPICTTWYELVSILFLLWVIFRSNVRFCRLIGTVRSQCYVSGYPIPQKDQKLYGGLRSMQTSSHSIKFINSPIIQINFLGEKQSRNESRCFERKITGIETCFNEFFVHVLLSC